MRVRHQLARHCRGAVVRIQLHAARQQNLHDLERVVVDHISVVVGVRIPVGVPVVVRRTSLPERVQPRSRVLRCRHHQHHLHRAGHRATDAECARVRNAIAAGVRRRVDVVPVVIEYSVAVDRVRYQRRPQRGINTCRVDSGCLRPGQGAICYKLPVCRNIEHRQVAPIVERRRIGPILHKVDCRARSDFDLQRIGFDETTRGGLDGSQVVRRLIHSRIQRRGRCNDSCVQRICRCRQRDLNGGRHHHALTRPQIGHHCGDHPVHIQGHHIALARTGRQGEGIGRVPRVGQYMRVDHQGTGKGLAGVVGVNHNCRGTDPGSFGHRVVVRYRVGGAGPYTGRVGQGTAHKWLDRDRHQRRSARRQIS